MCSSCTCTDGGRKLRRIAHTEGVDKGLRGANPNELGEGRGGRDLQFPLLTTGRSLSPKWGWDDCWAHYWFGFQEDVNLATTGLEPAIRDRWENGAGGNGDGIVDDLTELICEDGIMSGRGSGGEEVDGEYKDPALSRPVVSSSTYRIGGWKLRKQGTVKAAASISSPSHSLSTMPSTATQESTVP